MRRWTIFGLLLLVAVALFLRGGDLALRPLHNDEAINAFKLQQLWQEGRYTYDPEEFHGPTLYYASIPVLAVARWFHPDQPDETGMRTVAVVFGLGLLLLVLLVVDGLGWPAAALAALLTAVSPMVVYYSRYYIHEILFVFAGFLTLAALWRYLRRPVVLWAIVGGAGVGLMYATKETFVFNVVALAAAWIVVSGWLGTAPNVGSASGSGMERPGKGDAIASRDPSSRVPDQAPATSFRRRLGSALAGIDRRHFAVAVAAGAVVALALFTSFFTNLRGAWDAVRTYFIWLERAGGASPHIHPWSFYFGRLFWFHERGGPIWTEAGIGLLAVVGITAAARSASLPPPRRWFACFVSVHTLVLAAIYSVIPYKTPWCALGFLHGAILLAGVGGGFLVRAGRGWLLKVAFGVLIASMAIHLGWQAWRATREYPADFRNPYVYAHTSADIFNLLSQVEELAGASPDGHQTSVAVMAADSDYWPLPWYLRRFPQAGWWDREVPEAARAPVMIAASRLKVSLEEKTNQAWLMVGLFELRPRYFVELYVEAALWQRFLAARAAAHAAGAK